MLSVCLMISISSRVGIAGEFEFHSQIGTGIGRRGKSSLDRRVENRSQVWTETNRVSSLMLQYDRPLEHRQEETYLYGTFCSWR